jgi:hypothetical protein
VPYSALFRCAEQNLTEQMERIVDKDVVTFSHREGGIGVRVLAVEPTG